jgi:general stress protein 26
MFWPDGPDDPDFLVIRCRPTAIEVWDSSLGITPAPFGLVGAGIERTGASWSLIG